MLEVVRLLGSDQAGERAAAANALYRILKSNGLDIHRFAQAVDTGLNLDFATNPTVLNMVQESFKHGFKQGYVRGEEETRAKLNGTKPAQPHPPLGNVSTGNSEYDKWMIKFILLGAWLFFIFFCTLAGH